MLYTKNFVKLDETNLIQKTEKSPENMPQISPDRVFYKIDDFTITQDTQSIPVDKSIKVLKDLWGSNLMPYIKGISQYLSDDIPVVTYEDYLREIKDLLTGNNVLQLKRFSISTTNNCRIDSVIIINKYPDHYVLMNELYIDHKFNKAVEYSFNKIAEEYQKLL